MTDTSLKFGERFGERKENMNIELGEPIQYVLSQLKNEF